MVGQPELTVVVGENLTRIRLYLTGREHRNNVDNADVWSQWAAAVWSG